jgi:hypothetical protein
MAVSWSAVLTAFSSSSVPGIEPQLDHRISQNTMEPEAEPEFGVKPCCRMPSSVNVYAGNVANLLIVLLRLSFRATQQQQDELWVV